MSGDRDYERGQRDHNEGRWERPHGMLDEILSGPKENREGWERNDQYDKGWNNACDTAKRK